MWTGNYVFWPALISKWWYRNCIRRPIRRQKMAATPMMSHFSDIHFSRTLCHLCLLYRCEYYRLMRQLLIWRHLDAIALLESCYAPNLCLKWRKHFIRTSFPEIKDTIYLASKYRVWEKSPRFWTFWLFIYGQRKWLSSLNLVRP